MIRERPRFQAVVLLLSAAFFLRGAFLAIALPYADPLDEPFHLGYASSIADASRIPRATSLSMPADILRPMALLPRSVIFRGEPARPLSWKEFWSESALRRAERRQEAFRYEPAQRKEFVSQNYEVQQPPFAYLLAAGLLRTTPLAPVDSRLVLLRLFNALLAAMAVLPVHSFLRRLMPRGAALTATVAFVAFPGVGSFAGRFSNDALALPIAAGLLVLFADAARGRLSAGKASLLAALLAAGCWTKIYFLLLLPVAPLAVLLSPRGRRAGTWKRALAASALAFLLFLPWMVRQKRDTGDWFGLTPSKQALTLGIGVLDRLKSLPDLLTPRFGVVFGRTFLWPGTWSASGAPAPLAVFLSLALLTLFLVPEAKSAPPSKSRARAWRAGGLAVGIFLAGQLAYASTSAAIGRLRGHAPSSGPDGWYILILFPVILSAGSAFGRFAFPAVFLVAAAIFLAADWYLSMGVLPAVYGGSITFNASNAPFSAHAASLSSPLAALRIFEGVGLARSKVWLLGAVLSAWVLSLAVAAVTAAYASRRA